jgi:hypothetical protein
MRWCSVANNGLASVRKLIEAEFGKIRQHQEPAELLIVAAEESFETKANALYAKPFRLCKRTSWRRCQR